MKVTMRRTAEAAVWKRISRIGKRAKRGGRAREMNIWAAPPRIRVVLNEKFAFRGCPVLLAVFAG